MTKLTKDSLSLAAGVATIVGTIMAISGVTVRDIVPNQSWWVYLLLLVALFFGCFMSVRVVLLILSQRRITLKVGSNTVSIVQGDIFERAGWKVIPFNDRFDTLVDDITISRSSLNGIFITDHVRDLTSLKEALDKTENSKLSISRDLDGTLRYELGYIKRYESEYLLLALTHFDEQQRAHLSMSEYELCLMNMWRELSRTYAGKPINLPLLGSGITRFDDVPEKSLDDLLRCMMCTLRATGETFRDRITIVITEQARKEMHLYEVKGLIGNGV